MFHEHNVPVKNANLTQLLCHCADTKSLAAGKNSDWEGLWKPVVTSSRLRQGSRCKVLFHRQSNTMLLQQLSSDAASMTPLSLLLAWQAADSSQSACSVVHSGLEYWAGQGDS